MSSSSNLSFPPLNRAWNRHDGLVWDLDSARQGLMQQGKAHVWLLNTDGGDENAHFLGLSVGDDWQAYRCWMSESERNREGRFHFEKDRRTFVLSRALLRWALSCYLERDPTVWAFATGLEGKDEADMVCRTGVWRRRVGFVLLRPTCG